MVHFAKNEHINIFFVYALSVCCVITFSISHRISQYIPKKTKGVIEIEKNNAPIVFNKNAFTEVKIEGKAYVVYDLLTKEVIASKNETTILPLASVTKVMTALTATLHNKKDSTIIITQKSIEDGYDLGLKKNQSWTLAELLKYTLVFSSNDGAEAIADNFGGATNFLKQMNDDAKLLGLNFLFTDPAGRDLRGAIGGQGNALDVAKLFGIARKQIPELLDATTKKRQTVKASDGKISGIPNTNQSIEDLGGAEASKTGYTDLAGGNLGVIVDISVGHPVVIVVLGSTREGRFKDMNTLYTALRRSIENRSSN